MAQVTNLQNCGNPASRIDTQVVQLHTAGVLPGPRAGYSAVYDAATNQMMTWAARTAMQFTSSCWVLSHANGL